MKKKTKTWHGMKRPTKKQVQALRICLGISGVPTNDMTAELILTIQSEMKKLKGNFSLHDGVRIEYCVQNYYKPKIA